MRYDREWLMGVQEAGKEVELLLFWGHAPAKDGRVTKSCFSQWWVAPFEVDGRTYRTAEHWMMAGKAKLFGDEETLDLILKVDEPKDVKAAGRLVKGFDAGIWDAHKYGIVVEGNWHKYRAHERLGRFLLDTGDKILVEASPVDAIWGIGMGQDDPAARVARTWRGDNLLGFALMEVRDKMRAI
jgi:ribA/ribD-fused uncharacterized protein